MVHVLAAQAQLDSEHMSHLPVDLFNGDKDFAAFQLFDTKSNFILTPVS